MMLLKASLLGPPRVFANGVEVSFPLRKSALLFFYLLTRKRVGRESAAAWLWPEADEAAARKNLRNTLYTIHKTLGADILARHGRPELSLADEVDLDLDIDRLAAAETGDLRALYRGEFLEGFSFSGLEEAENWLRSKRAYFKKLYFERQKAHVLNLFNDGHLEAALNLAEELPALDELDEEAYELIIRLNARLNRRARCMEIFQKLTAMLKKEYSLTPSRAIREVVENLSRDRADDPAGPGASGAIPLFFGRESNLTVLIDAARNFDRGRETRSVAVLGEAGIGKTNLVRRFVSTWTSTDVEILASGCHHAEEKFPLRPWSQIFIDCLNLLAEEKISLPPRWVDIISQIFPGFVPEGGEPEPAGPGDVQGLYNHAVEETMISALRRIAETKKLLIILEDIHWIDEVSLRLLKKLLFIDRNRSILVVVTSRPEKNHCSRKYITDLTARDLVETMELKRLDEQQVEEFAALALPGEMMTPQLKNQIYRETEGNLFFLVEFIKNLKNKSAADNFTPGMRSVLDSRILNISREGRDLLNLMSISFDKVALDDLQILSGLSDEQIADRLDELYDQGLVEEQNDHDGCQLLITHQKLRQYVYGQMPFSRRKVLHAKYARLLEGRVGSQACDNKLYSRLIYHFTEMGDLRSLLKYSLKSIGEYFHFNHEVFPVLGDMALTRDRFLYSNQQQAVSRLLAVEDLVRRLESQGEAGDEFLRLKLTFFHMFGRLYLRDGDYENGLRMIEVVIGEALRIKDFDIAYDGYRQMFCFCMNTLDIESMRRYIEAAFKIVGKCREPGKTAILKRLNGYLHLMEGNYDESEKCLRQSIVEFKELEQYDRYVINVAAAYYFLGENNRRRSNFDRALHYYTKGFNLCEEKQWLKGLGVIYAAASQAAYELGEKRLTEELTRKAIHAYSRHDQIWGKSIAYSMHSLLSLEKGKISEALADIAQAENAATVLRNAYEIGLAYAVKAEICGRLGRSPGGLETNGAYGEEMLETYCLKALECFQGLHGCYEAERLKMLLV